MKKNILMTGVIDQDGAFLSEFSFKKVSQVHSIKKKGYNFSTRRVEYIYHDPSWKYILRFEDGVQRFYNWYINNSGN